MDKPRPGWRARLTEPVQLPSWGVLILFLCTAFNVLIFFTLVQAFWRPNSVPVPITGDVVFGLHLQLFEAFLAALAFALALFGFVGFTTIRDLAERRAESIARDYMQRHTEATAPSVPPAVTLEPNLAGLDRDVQPGDREPEGQL